MSRNTFIARFRVGRHGSYPRGSNPQPGIGVEPGSRRTVKQALVAYPNRYRERNTHRSLEDASRGYRASTQAFARATERRVQCPYSLCDSARSAESATEGETVNARHRNPRYRGLFRLRRMESYLQKRTRGVLQALRRQNRSSRLRRGPSEARPQEIAQPEPDRVAFPFFRYETNHRFWFNAVYPFPFSAQRPIAFELIATEA